MKNDLKHNAGKNLLAQSSELSGKYQQVYRNKHNNNTTLTGLICHKRLTNFALDETTSRVPCILYRVLRQVKCRNSQLDDLKDTFRKYQ